MSLLETFDWYSSNTAIATVKDGVITGHNCGTCKITIINRYYPKLRGSFTVIVHRTVEKW
ncbi:MAG: hypothetical protein K6F59_01190 [Gammaproteobacteria bacterium]|nr:hypothetical protein [Gammaproteobacteria bacterium]